MLARLARNRGPLSGGGDRGYPLAQQIDRPAELGLIGVAPLSDERFAPCVSDRLGFGRVVRPHGDLADVREADLCDVDPREQHLGVGTQS